MLVLLNANMPDLDGFSVAEEILRRPELAGSTIMMLTSSGQYGDASRCRQLRIAAYLTKPIKHTDLLEAICEVLEGTAEPASPVAAPLTVDPARQVKVLLAEDNVVNQRVAVGLLKRRGHEVVVVQNGQVALDALERESFDVVLMDVQMPVMGGLEATNRIRIKERATGTHVRIVALTAHAMSGDRERYMAAGMDGYLAKPIDRIELYDAVERPAHEPPATTASSAEEASPMVFNYKELLHRVGDDDDLAIEVIGVFLDDCPTRLDAIEAAVSDGNAEHLRHAAHAFKGAAANIAAAQVAATASTLEVIGASDNLSNAPEQWRLLRQHAVRLAAILKDTQHP